MSDLIKIETDKISKILTKAGDSKALTFRTIDDKALAKIEAFMPVVNEKAACFSKQNSQTTSSLMTLNMVDSGPYRVLRQILAQVEKKRAALKDVMFKTEKKKIQHEKVCRELENKELDTLDRYELELKRSKIEADIVDSAPHIESAIKEIGSYMERYNQIKENNNIPDEWDEKDFEEAEIKHHIISIFKNMIRDRMQGAANTGSMEYAEQFGIEPILAYSLVDGFISSVREGMKVGPPSIETRYQFYEQMYQLFKEEYKRSIKRTGLNELVYDEWLLRKDS